MTTPPTVAHRLHIGADGRLRGKAWITYNDPWAAPNGQTGLVPPMNGALMHTMVGDLPGTITVFSRPGFDASAHFGIGGPWSKTDGQIHQFGPVNGWMAWHAENANNDWFGIEHEDGGDPAHPLTDAQMTASAQVLEALSAQGGGWGFPLRVTDHTRGRGFGAHYLGGVAWGGHTCPDPAPGGQGPRSHQRHEIVRRAKILRKHGQYPAPVKPPANGTWIADGVMTLAALAAQHKTAPSTILRLSADPLFSPEVAKWLDGACGTGPGLADPVPVGTVLVVPGS